MPMRPWRLQRSPTWARRKVPVVTKNDSFLAFANAVAEGVETAEDFALLCQLRCDFAQGHYFAKAMPHDEWVGWARSWNPERGCCP